ncbi:cGMP-specific 3',5'-cyclic phosphodiesterase-like isoform X1 [Acipenser oxyrinchus oxyrinchus]|uniref:Phosphodiesterase n=1 Tax=Acipenser oxyrinchus oxyrinchus TaxID=40147 RepID=A0AAD8GJ36_ACIOX|nr:cGMP-specific 3',5'-cyclic phosphodiesterase-like isoform X1 [Acipenser oxyrinchus oxyrinchus]
MDSFNPSENERMEAWLDDHLNFAHSYFVRKATRDMVNAWFAERVHSIPAHKEGTKLPAEPSPIHQTVQPENTTPGTPTRKISASEFDRPLRPIVVKDSEGALTFVCDSEKVQMPLKPQILGAGEGQVSNQCTRLLELVKDISTHLDVTALCHKIFLHINELIDADRYSLFLVCEDSSNEKFLISRLFDVAEDSTLEEASNNCIRLEWNKGIVGHVAATGRPLNIRNAYEDPRFNAGVDQITGYKTQSILCMPIKNHREEVVGVAQAINKKCGKNGTFTEQDEKDFSAYLAFCGIVLHNAQLYETSRLENRRNQVLLDLASLIFEEQQSLEVILKKIAATILSFMQAQRCTIFIADGDISNSFSSVFHMEYEELGESAKVPKRDCDVSKINYMYAQYVKNTMGPLNIGDITKDERFPGTNENAENSNKQIKSLLCTPIKNGKKDKVIGVCQLVNKMDEVTGKIKAFNRNDEQFLEAFAIFCGLGIQNTQMYETVDRAMAKQVVTLEVLSYHASASEEETRELQVTAATKVPSAQSLKLLDFSFSDFELSDMETTLATIRMFMDLNLVQNFQMKYEGLCQWVLSVKKNYRKNIAYHNWRHAFNTSQCMFAVLKSGRIQNKLNDLEMLALMIATLCHDLDHRGVNNSYIQRSEHPLAQLYCHSTMEHHHFDQCLMILNSPGNQILSGLSLEEYRTTLKMIERAILATDLALYMKKRGEFFELTKNRQFMWEDEHHRDLLRSMLMTACDISAITKPWPVQRRVAELVATEFFEQGDKERKELNIEPIDLMNRDKRDKIPSMQVGFIDAICIQLYETLAGLSEACSPLLEGCRKNRQNWKLLAEQDEKKLVNGAT